MSTDYKRLARSRFPSIQERETAEARYWRRFTQPILITKSSSASSIHFSPAAPHHFAVTWSTNVSVHDARTGKEQRSLGRAEAACYSGRFRHDGKLLACGDAMGSLRVLDVVSKGVLRHYKEHEGAVRAVGWSANGTALASAGDDKVVRIWDLPSQDGSRALMSGHTDYVRAIEASPVGGGDIWLSASYDHTARLWDARLPSRDQGGVLSLQHDAPLETCLFLPGGGLVACAAGNEVKVWDLVGGGRLLHTCSNHLKTITCLAMDGTGTRLLSGGLDRQVKVYSLQSYRVTHGLRFHAPVLSLALPRDSSLLVAGTTDNVLTIRKRKEGSATGSLQYGDSSSSGVQGGDSSRGRALNEGVAPHPGSKRYRERGKGAVAGAGDATVTVARSSKSLKVYDKSLKAFQYQAALDQALDTRDPVVVVTVLEELRQRGCSSGLKTALASRDEQRLEPLLAFLTRYIVNPRYAPLLCDVTEAVLDLYGDVLGESEAIDELFAKLCGQVRMELDFQKQMQALKGSLDTVLACSSSAAAALSR